ncbi:32658_t:CDS:1, partial [Racocetra persica]
MVGISTIENVEFSLLGDKDHEKNAHMEIHSYELFLPGGQPVDGGIYDLKLGTTDHSYLCAVCQNGKKKCPGHRGYLALKAG